MEVLKIGIRNNDSERSKIISQIFEIVNKKIKDKKGYDYSIEIIDYELLKNQFSEVDKPKVLQINKGARKALTEFTKNIILFSDIFFNASEIEKESIFLHEIGHIANKPKTIDNDNPIIDVYFEYLADKFLFEIDDFIFKVGRIEADLKLISIDYIKEQIRTSNHNEWIIKGKILDVIRLKYYYNLCKHESIIEKIKSLTSLIKIHFSKIDIILESLDVFCNEFNKKSESDLYNLSRNIDNQILNLNF